MTTTEITPPPIYATERGLSDIAAARIQSISFDLERLDVLSDALGPYAPKSWGLVSLVISGRDKRDIDGTLDRDVVNPDTLQPFTANAPPVEDIEPLGVCEATIDNIISQPERHGFVIAAAASAPIVYEYRRDAVRGASQKHLARP